MGWITLSLRKLVLTQRVNELEHRLTKLSQEQQTLANSSSYAERIIGIDKSDQYRNLYSNYANSFNEIAQNYSNASATDVGLAGQYMTDIQTKQLEYLYNKMNIDSIFTAKEQMIQDEVNQKQTNLALEQEQIETQLEAARAEKEQLDKAISEDIKASTISLV